jgi:16S rRNA A1518/A1519 N6-dimethyltransferase RsmA/KsgA/DIM1 with predicted DNA glycosylase/AP lyase activity
MLRSSLKSIWPQPEAILQRLGIDPAQRAEALPVADFIRLAQVLAGET